MAVMDKVQEHLKESYEFFPENNVVGIFLQGSQNYGLEIESSDVDTKLIVTPTFEEIAMNRKPHSTTHIRANQEHIDFKDVRLMIQTYRKQNLNFVETLFTDYQILNPKYEYQWNRLRQVRERIARYSPYQAVKAMKGVAMEKYHAMEHEYPSKLDILATFGYDPKQVSHLVRIHDFLSRYIVGEVYEDCLKPKCSEFIKDIKLGKYSLEEARNIANLYINKTVSIADDFCSKTSKDAVDTEVDVLLNDVQLNIMREAIRDEFVLSAW